MRFTIVSGLGGIFVTLGKLAISLTSTYAGYAYITKTPAIRELLVGTMAPTFVN